MTTLKRKIEGETDHCRYRLMKYCRGQGLDLGCGMTKIRDDAIGIDLYYPDADMKGDARILDKYPDNHFDYIFSSHLLEEIEDTKAVIQEWLRVLKPGGNLVLYQADKNTYYSFDDPRCNKNHKHHFTKEELWNIIRETGNVKLIHAQDPIGDEWSFELVVQKSGKIMDIKLCEDGISILVPTLNRPSNMERLAISINNTTKFPEKVELLFGIHKEDTESIKKSDELKNKCKIGIRYEIIKRYHDKKINLSFLWNQLYAKALNPIVGYFGDDVIFHTPGWDEEIRKEFSIDKVIMVYTNDVHIQRGKQATLFFTHKCVHNYFSLYLDERFRRWYMDTYWEHIFRIAKKLHYREDIVCEHIHPDAFPDKIDNVYKNMDHFKDSDRSLWNSPSIQNEIREKASLLSQIRY